MQTQESSAAWLARVMLRDGGWLLVLEVDFETAIDESGTHDGSPVICMAGYIMEKSQAQKLDQDWDAVLNWKYLEHPLPYFHMTDCAPDPGFGVFAGISKANRIQVVSQLIAVIKRHTVQGIAVTVDPSEFEELLAGHPLYPDPYVLLTHLLMAGVSNWIEAQAVSVKRMAYIFEAGHDRRHDADLLVDLYMRKQIYRDQYRYAGHAFVPKLGNPTVQAADLLAWQWLKDRKNHAEGRKRRRDLISLLDHHHSTTHVGPDVLSKLAKTTEPLNREFNRILEKVRHA